MSIVRFKKEEINLIMKVYSRKISAGEWKDYSISFQKNYAVFSINKSVKFAPYYQIKKNLMNKRFNIIDLIILSKLENSKSEIRRLIKGNAVKINNEIIDNNMEYFKLYSISDTKS